MRRAQLALFAAVAIGSAGAHRVWTASLSRSLSPPNPPPALYAPDNPCGPASVAIITALLGDETVSDEAAARAVHADSYGHSTAENLIVGLSRLGYVAAAVEAADLESCRASVVGPVIAHLRQGHFVVIKVTENDTVVAMDGTGAKVVPADRFRGEWSGHVILVKKTRAELDRVLGAIGVRPS